MRRDALNNSANCQSTGICFCVFLYKFSSDFLFYGEQLICINFNDSIRKRGHFWKNPRVNSSTGKQIKRNWRIGWRTGARVTRCVTCRRFPQKKKKKVWSSRADRMCLNNNLEGEKMFRLVLMGPCVRSGSPSYLKREELPFPFCRPAETPAPVLANQNKKEKTLLWFPKTKRKLCPRKKKGQFNGTKKWPLKWPTTWPDYTAVSPTFKKKYSRPICWKCVLFRGKSGNAERIKWSGPG